MISIKRGLLQSFDPSTYTASVLLLEATSAYLSGVPISTAVNANDAIAGAFCAVLFFDSQNYTDAVIVACYPNGTSGLPTPPPAASSVKFVAAYEQVAAALINNGVTQTFTLTGAGGIPSGVSGVIYSASVYSPTVGAYIELYPHAASNPGYYQAVGSVQVAGQTVYGNGLLQVDNSGKIDITAVVGNCTVFLFTQGYVM